RPSPVTEETIVAFAARRGVERRAVGDEEILDRCLLPMVNEGAKILAEGVAQRAPDSAAVWGHRYGWPAYRGGPMYWADQVGLDAVLDKLEALQARFGTDFAPAPLIRTLAAETRGFRDLEPRGAGRA